MTLTKCDNCGKVVRYVFTCKAESVTNLTEFTASSYYNFDLCKDCLDTILTNREKLEKERDEATYANRNDI